MMVEMGSRPLGFLPFVWHTSTEKECNRLEWIKTQLVHEKHFFVAHAYAFISSTDFTCFSGELSKHAWKHIYVYVYVCVCV
jgi:hypothetical protein